MKVNKYISCNHACAAVGMQAVKWVSTCVLLYLYSSGWVVGCAVPIMNLKCNLSCFASELHTRFQHSALSRIFLHVTPITYLHYHVLLNHTAYNFMATILIQMWFECLNRQWNGCMNNPWNE